MAFGTGTRIEIQVAGRKMFLQISGEAEMSVQSYCESRRYGSEMNHRSVSKTKLYFMHIIYYTLRKSSMTHFFGAVVRGDDKCIITQYRIGMR